MVVFSPLKCLVIEIVRVLIIRTSLLIEVGGEAGDIHWDSDVRMFSILLFI